MKTKCKRLIKQPRYLLFLVFLLIAATNTSKGGNEARDVAQCVTLSEKNISLSQLIWKMKQQTGVVFAYNTEDIDQIIIAELIVACEPVNAVLSKCLEKTDLEYNVVEGVVVLKKRAPAPVRSPQQNPAFTLKGHIADENDEPLIGVTVMIKGTDMGTITDFDGNYMLKGVKPGQVIRISYIGKETVERVAASGTSVINVTLKDKDALMNDVVITGYQTTSKERVTGSYSILSTKDIENKTETNLMSRIEGLVAGINSSGENQPNDLIIRGRSTVHADKQILYILDGVPFEGNLDQINPNDVANVTVLKDAAAASIYGARAANGVIVITTHKGRAGKTKVNYNGSIRFSEAPSPDHLNLMSSSELVDYFQTVYNTVTPRGFSFKNHYNTSWDQDIFRDPVYDALAAYDNGSISDSELNSRLQHYSLSDNRKQLRDAFARTAVTHQHNLSVSGGSDVYKFYMSGNFMNQNPHDKFRSSKQYGINSKNEFNISPKLSAYVNLSVNLDSSDQSNYNTSSYSGMMTNYPSYYMLKDKDGTLLHFSNGRNYTLKSEEEINRLIALGLKDEHYYPTLDAKVNLQAIKTNYMRVQGGFNWKITDGLTASATYQTEMSYSKRKVHFLEDSYYIRSNINDAAQEDQGVITYNFPVGGQLNEWRSDQQSYTLRGQLDYSKTFNEDHTVTALAGGERREVRHTSSQKILLAYDENGMQGVNPDPALSFIAPTEAIYGYYRGNYQLFNTELDDSEDRFVSFYGNAAYSYRHRYDVSGSLRFDESGLFGRKASNKWKPVWSSGLSWHISKEDFMQDIDFINRLTLRLTYGIGGNLPRSFGSHPQVVALSNDSYTNLYPLAYIREAKNERLTWEKTATTNVGVDFSFFNSRLRGSVDYYQKRTTDLLGNKSSDPTLGWETVKMNYGDMDNKGVEIELNGLVKQTRRFNWNAMLTFAYNENKVRNFEVAQTTADFLYNDVLQLGKPLASVYSTRYAGLDSEYGEPLFYNKDNEKVAYTALTKDDLVYSGTRIPKFTSALVNSFSYKNIELSFKLMYYGGNVIRDHSLKALSGQEASNFNKQSLNFWKAPGDEVREVKPNGESVPDLQIAPALNPTTKGRWELGWLARDTSIKKADYIKLRSISITYNVPKSILRKINVEQLSLSFQADNLAWWASNGNIDPESSFSYHEYYYTAMRSKPIFSYGVNLNF